MITPIKNINKDFHLVVAMAETDLLTVNTFIKKYFLPVSLNTVKRNISDEVDSKVGDIMVALHQVDVFTQRIKHLVTTHEKMLNDELTTDLKRSFYHLYYFQLLTTQFDFVNTISLTRSLIDHLKKYLVGELEMHLPENNLFMHCICIKQTLENILKVFSSAGGDMDSLPEQPFSGQQLQMLRSIYTMDAEAFVLNWFLNNIEMGTPYELLISYQSRMPDIEDDPSTVDYRFKITAGLIEQVKSSLVKLRAQGT